MSHLPRARAPAAVLPTFGINPFEGRVREPAGDGIVGERSRSPSCYLILKTWWHMGN